MKYLLDTDVAIHLRDAEPNVRARLADLSEPAVISLVSLIELKGGAMAGKYREQRRLRLAAMLKTINVLALDEAVVEAYALIVERAGFSRSRILDRLIAATAIVNDLTLLTINGAHFRDIPDLKLEVWPSPAQ